MDNFSVKDQTVLLKPSTIQYYQAITNRVHEYVEANIHTDISLQQLADHVFISYHHFTEIFEKTEQQSIGSYIKRYRIEKAATLLSYTDLSLAIIAEKTGYSGRHALSKAFSQRFNQSPGSFRKKPVFLKNSPNAIMDGICSEQEYYVLLKKDIPFNYRIETVHNLFTICSPLRMVPALYSGRFSYETYLREVKNGFEIQWSDRLVIKPFDSLNFSAAELFSMHHGILVTGEEIDLFSAARPGYITSPVKEGEYLVFDIPAGPVDENIKNYTTYFRENIIGYKKLFRPADFFSFLLLRNDESKLGEFFMYLQPATGK